MLNQYKKLFFKFNKEEHDHKDNQREPLSTEIIKYEKELTSLRPEILNIPNIPNNLLELLRNGWNLQNIDVEPFIKQIDSNLKKKINQS